jgi:hypothetical protein
MEVNWRLDANVESLSPSVATIATPTLIVVTGTATSTFDALTSWTPVCRHDGDLFSAEILTFRTARCTITPTRLGSREVEIALDGTTFTSNDVRLTTVATTTGVPTTGVPTTGIPTTGIPTTGIPTTGVPTTGIPTTTANPATTTAVPTTAVPQTTTGTTTGVPTTTGAVSSSTGVETNLDESSSGSAGADFTLYIVIAAVACAVCCVVVAAVVVWRRRSESPSHSSKEANDANDGDANGNSASSASSGTDDVVVYGAIGDVECSSSADGSSSAGEIVYAGVDEVLAAEESQEWV